MASMAELDEWFVDALDPVFWLSFLGLVHASYQLTADLPTYLNYVDGLSDRELRAEIVTTADQVERKYPDDHNDRLSAFVDLAWECYETVEEAWNARHN